MIDARNLVEDDVSARYAVREPDFYEQELGWYRDRPRPFLGRGFFYVDFSLFRPLEFFVDPKNGDGRNNNPPAMRVRVDCYTKKLPFRVQ